MQKSLFNIKKYGSQGWGGAKDHEFWYTFSKDYSDIIY